MSFIFRPSTNSIAQTRSVVSFFRPRTTHIPPHLRRCVSIQHKNRISTSTRASTKLKQSGISYIGLVVAFGLTIGGAVVWNRFSSRQEEQLPGQAAEQKSTVPSDDFIATLVLGMPSEIPPGRPGNLTAEQEAKLREFWQATLQVFGVFDSAAAAAESNGEEAQSIAQSDGAAGASKKKKKKSRLHLFHKKKDADGAADSPKAGSGTATPTNVTSVSEENDKHGQTKEFKQALASQTPEQLHDAFWSMVKHDHPDGLLLRFLRARKWDVQNALVMMIATMHWRATEMHVDSDIMINGEAAALEASKSQDAGRRREAEDFLAQMRMGKSFLHGVDKDGRPLCHVRVRLHRQGEQSESSLERYTVYTIETARMMLRPPVDTATIVFDMTNFSMANMDYTPVKFMIKCFEANYPESLGAVLVYKAPWVFNAVWNIIRGWLDPVVAGKVHFAKTVDELATYIPRSHIIQELGGDEDWTYSYVEPRPNENAAMADTATRDTLIEERKELVRRYEEATTEWIAGDEGAEVGGQRNKIAAELRDSYWRLDPFVRARTLYDRTGIIKPGGGLEFYPPARKAVETSADDVD